MSVWWAKPNEQRATYQMIMPQSYAGTLDSDYSAPDLSDPRASLQVVACWSAIDLVSSLVSELPVDVFRGKGADREELDTPANLMDPGGDGHGVEDWLWQLLISWLFVGNAAGEVIERDPRSGFPTYVTWADPSSLHVTRDQGRLNWTLGGTEVPTSNVFHRRVFPYPGAVLGLSPIEYHATTLGLSISATRFGAAYFTDNATPTGMLMNEDEEIGGTRAAEVKRKFLNALRGKREPVVLGKGWKYQQLGIAPEESQFLETNQFTAAQCARIYGPGIAEVLGYESGGSLTYATVEGRSLHLLVYALSKWITRAERVLTSLTPRGQYVKLNRKALLSTTNIERFRAYTMALQGRWTTPNEVRDNEDLPPVEWGDEPITGGAAPADDGQANSGTGAPALSGAGGV